jgi:hypothetical protein
VFKTQKQKDTSIYFWGIYFLTKINGVKESASEKKALSKKQNKQLQTAITAPKKSIFRVYLWITTYNLIKEHHLHKHKRGLTLLIIILLIIALIFYGGILIFLHFFKIFTPFFMGV